MNGLSPMHENDLGSDNSYHSGFVHTRSKPKGKAGEVGKTGTISQCIPGDEVTVFDSGQEPWFAVIAWIYKDGAAMVRINGDATSEALKVLEGSSHIIWKRMRPK